MSTPDPTRFEAFMRAHQDRVYSLASRLTGGSPEAEDLAQQAFLRAYDHFAGLVDNPAAGAWLRVTTTRLCLNHLQRHRWRWRLFSEMDRDEEGEGAADYAASIPDETSSAPHASRAEAIEEALSRLPQAQRVPIVLFHYEDLSYEEISRQLGVSLSKVKTDILRGREKLRRILGPLLALEESPS